MALYVDSKGSIIYGVTEQFTFSKSTSTHRRRSKNNILHLTRAKPEMVEVTGLFIAAHEGTRVDAGEFEYSSRSGYLRIINAVECSGLADDGELNYDIPITQRNRSTTILTNIYQDEIVVSGAMSTTIT